jgi:hypothetical protein
MISTWARRVAVPKLRPDVTVLGVVSREFNPNDPEQQRLTREFFAAPAVRELLGTETILEKAERRLEDVSAIARYRVFVRQPTYLATLIGLKQGPTDTEYGAYVSADGQYQGFLTRTYPDAATIATLFRKRALNDFEIGDQQLATFRSLVTYLKANAKRVIVVSMPITKDYVAAHPRGEADYQAFRRALGRETDDLGVQLVDVGIWSRKYFADPAHLNARGSARISATLDDVLAEAGSS